jgi:hypothetical protein
MLSAASDKKPCYDWNCVSNCSRRFSTYTKSSLLKHQEFCKQYNDQKSLNHFTSPSADVLSQDHSSISQDDSSIHPEVRKRSKIDISQDDLSEVKKRSKIDTISTSTSTRFLHECVSGCSRAFHTNSLHQLNIHRSQCSQYKIQREKQEKQEKQDEKLALQLQATDAEALHLRIIQEEIDQKTQPEHIAFNFIKKIKDSIINSADIKVCIRIKL